MNRRTDEAPTILLVEDDAEMRDLMASALRRDGYSVIEAADRDQAFEWLGDGLLGGHPERLPAAIVSDIRLPYGSGTEILEITRLSPRWLPVVLITGFGDPETHRDAQELGAVCVLDKPFAMEELSAAVRTALRPAAPPPPKALDGHRI